MAARKPTRLETGFLLTFHAALSGSVIVAYFSGDEDTYTMHMVAGYTALAALGLRLAAALVAPAGSPLRLARPSPAATRDWLGRIRRADAAAMRGRSPLYAWGGAAMLALAAAAGLSGWIADGAPTYDGLHAALSNAVPALVGVHLATVLALHVLRQRGQALARPATQGAR